LKPQIRFGRICARFPRACGGINTGYRFNLQHVMPIAIRQAIATLFKISNGVQHILSVTQQRSISILELRACATKVVSTEGVSSAPVRVCACERLARATGQVVSLGAFATIVLVQYLAGQRGDATEQIGVLQCHVTRTFKRGRISVHVVTLLNFAKTVAHDYSRCILAMIPHIPCFANTTRRIAELLIQISDEFSRVATIEIVAVAIHIPTRQQLTSVVIFDVIIRALATRPIFSIICGILGE
jgi:hypothetical protein